MRLPLQVPLIAWAWSLTNAAPPAETGPPVKLLQSPAVRVGLSISIATGLYGVSFGALSVTSGLDFWQTMALSLLLFSGGSQFAFIGVVAGGGSGVAAMGAATLLGMRNGIYGMQINALLRPRGWLRFAAAHVTIDESTATSTGQTDPLEQKRGFWTAGLGIFVLWNLFTAVGALAGASLGDPKQWGLDGAAVAAFLGLLWPRLKGREPVAIAVVCALATVLAVPLVPAGVPILVAAVVAAAIGWFSHGRSDEGLEPDVDPYAEHPHPAPSGEAQMTLWMWLLLSCLLAYAWKLLGYLVPASVLRDPRMSRIAGTMTIGLLASLTIVNTVASGQSLALDARLGPLARPESHCGSGRRSWWWSSPEPVLLPDSGCWVGASSSSTSLRTAP